MRIVLSVTRRELYSYFSTPLAAVFLVAFLGAAGALTFYVGGFMQREQADLAPFFAFHPWMFLVLMPAIGMRLWAEERRSGTIEFLMTLPLTTWQLVLGKFLAAWAFAALALVLTFPIWFTVNYLGSPDNGVILASYCGSFLMGGAFLALACCVSALTRNQVTAFVIGMAAGFLMLVSGLDPVLRLLAGWTPAFVADFIASFSFAERFRGITQGVLDLRDVFYFLSFIALMLFLNVQILSVRLAPAPMKAARGSGLSSAATSFAAVGLVVILFLSLNLLSALELRNTRFDLTENGLFTLGPSTRTVLAGIDEPITIRLYETRQFLSSAPRLQTYARRVSDLLSAYRDVAKGMVRVDTIETQPFSAEEDQALAMGLRGFPLSNAGEQGYFGLVGTNSVDSVETLSFLDPAGEQQLEYDLTRLIHRLSQTKEPVVRILDGLSMFGSPMRGQPAWAIISLMRRDFDVSVLPNDVTSIPNGTNALMIVHPTQLSAAQQYAIDQYVLGGGAALVFVDPVAENSATLPGNPYAYQAPSSDLAPLLHAWGVNMDSDHVVGDRNMALRTIATSGLRRVVTDYLPWLKIDGQAFNRDETITSHLQIMRMSSAGSIKALPDATTTVTPLIQTTEASMLIDKQDVLGHTNPTELLDNFKPSGERQATAVRISGTAKTAFPDGPPSDLQKPTQGNPQHLDGKVNVVVVSDTDMLADSHIVNENGQIISSNADFVLNAAENLAGADALIGLRSSGLAYRPFTTIEAMRARAEQAYRATEQRLTKELADTRQRLQALQNPQAASSQDEALTSQEQQRSIAEFNSRLVELRQQLRDVRAALRADIDRLETRLEIANIALVPALLILVAVLVEIWRRVRFARSRRRAGESAGAHS